VAIVEYASRGEHKPGLAERLKTLARPTLGHWWEFARELVPVLTAQGDQGFSAVRDVLDQRLEGLPYTAGLITTLMTTFALEQKDRKVRDVFDLIVHVRNKAIGHGSLVGREDAVYEKLADALQAGAEELFKRLDLLAGRRLVFVSEVRHAGGQVWSVKRLELAENGACELPILELPLNESPPPRAGCLYLEGPDGAVPRHLLRPLMLFDPETEDLFFLNSKSDELEVEYLCYTNNKVDKQDLGDERRELLIKALKTSVTKEDINAWARRYLRDEMASGHPLGAPEGQKLGDFQLIKELGRGATGVVYRAHQISMVREVALKVLAVMLDGRDEERFHRERRALATVDHPHLVKIHASGKAAGKLYYVMGLVDGAPLSRVWDELTAKTNSAGLVTKDMWHEAVRKACATVPREDKPVPASPGSASAPAAPTDTSQDWSYVHQVVKLLRHTAEAAHALHEKKVLHRDIKPGNIMVTVDGDNAVLVDLGLAKFVDTKVQITKVPDAKEQFTKYEDFARTPRYASPQQLLLSRSLNERTDVYSLGATLWELLALRRLFPTEDTADLMEAVQRGEPGRLQELDAAIPPDLDAVVQKCLEKEPQYRYATAKNLADDLGRWQRGEPVSARPPGQVELFIRWVRHNPTIAALATALVLLFVLATSLVTWKWLDAEDALALARSEKRRRTTAQIEALQTATPEAVPTILKGLKEEGQEALLRLRELYEQENDPGKKMRLALALLPVEPGKVRKELVDWMLEAENPPTEALLVRDVLKGQASAIAPGLWAKAAQPNTSGPVRLRALAALAAFDSDGKEWKGLAGVAVQEMLSANPLHLGDWIQGFRPVSSRLLPALQEQFRGDQQEHRSAAARVLADYAKDDPKVLTGLLLDADGKQYAVIEPALERYREKALPQLRETLARQPIAGLAMEQFAQQPALAAIAPAAPACGWLAMEQFVQQPALVAMCVPVNHAILAVNEQLARQQAQAAATLLRWGQPDRVWERFRHSKDPTMRSYLIQRAHQCGVKASLLVDRLNAEEDTSTRRALILALGDYTDKELPGPVRGPLVTKLLGWYENDPDAGVHGAIDWLLRHGEEGEKARPLDWGQREQLDKIDAKLAKRARDRNKSKAPTWEVNGQGMTFTVIHRPEQFHIGAPEGEPGRPDREPYHLRIIGRSFAIATKPVTVAQWKQFLKDRPWVVSDLENPYIPEDGCPIIKISWDMAAQFCNWLSEKEELPKCYPEEMGWFYLKIKEGKVPEPGYLDRKGYRLPTDAEWEYACRAGTTSSRSYGSSLDLLPRYSWFLFNSVNKGGEGRTWPVGQKRPNDFGLFDVHGNALAWCQNLYRDFDVRDEDQEECVVYSGKTKLVLRGGSFDLQPSYARSAFRHSSGPSGTSVDYGIRVVRTVADGR
jgi:serine/threonine protein kinase/formylglycine-generating enzyme required for sulfatase activity